MTLTQRSAKLTLRNAALEDVDAILGLQARAIENQLYVVTAGNVGNLPGVANMDVNYAQSAIITPCDFPFARDGLAAEASENVETIAVADLHMDSLAEARRSGTVRNLRDRRFDLYRIVWTDRG